MDLNGGLGRLYGTVGFAIDRPRLVVDIEESSVVEANDPFAERFARIVVKGFDLRGVRVVVRERFPEYIGLGYVTTLGLSIGLGIAEMHGLGLKIEDVAFMIRRGLLTALGLYACKLGGFIVEGGFRKDLVEKSVPPLIFRGEVPDDWLFVIAVPEAPRKRIAELRASREEGILREVSMSSEEASYLSRLVLMKIIPSFVEGDLIGFGEALTEFNRRLGLVWQRYQGGVYCDPIVDKGIEVMLKYAYGACQSSWGPTFYGILDREDEALKLVEELKRLLSDHGGGDVFIAKGRNKGLEVVEVG